MMSYIKQYRSWIGVVLLLIAYGFLIPGISLPAMSLEATVRFGFEVTLLDETKSILQAAQSLYQQGNPVIAVLITLFSMVVPGLKALLLIITLLPATKPYRFMLLKVVDHIGRWSMADVFTVGLLIAFLASQSSNALLKAELHQGFYYFATYCVLSIMAMVFIRPDSK